MVSSTSNDPHLAVETGKKLGRNLVPYRVLKREGGEGGERRRGQGEAVRQATKRNYIYKYDVEVVITGYCTTGIGQERHGINLEGNELGHGGDGVARGDEHFHLRVPEEHCDTQDT